MTINHITNSARWLLIQERKFPQTLKCCQGQREVNVDSAAHSDAHCRRMLLSVYITIYKRGSTGSLTVARHWQESISAFIFYIFVSQLFFLFAPQGIQILWRLLGNCFYRCMRWYLEVLPHIKTKRGCRMWIKWDKNSVGDAWMVFPGLTPALLFKALIIYIWHLVNATTRFLRIMIPFFFRTSGRR